MVSDIIITDNLNQKIKYLAESFILNISVSYTLQSGHLISQEIFRGNIFNFTNITGHL